LSFRLSGEIKDKELFKGIMDGGIERGGKVFYREDDRATLRK